jgi:hypothetical protein
LQKLKGKAVIIKSKTLQMSGRLMAAAIARDGLFCLWHCAGSKLR